jgi:hypothetical protein
MTIEERNVIYETVDILRAIGGNNGFSNLQPKIKKMLLGYATKLNEIADKDIKFGQSMKQEEFNGEIVYES